MRKARINPIDAPMDARLSLKHPDLVRDFLNMNIPEVEEKLASGYFNGAVWFEGDAPITSKNLLSQLWQRKAQTA